LSGGFNPVDGDYFVVNTLYMKYPPAPSKNKPIDQCKKGFEKSTSVPLA